MWHPLKTLMICTIGLMYFCCHGLRASLFQASKFVLCELSLYYKQDNNKIGVASFGA